MQGRHRKFLGLFVACTMLGFMGLVATPSAAHDPDDENADFSPSDFNGDGQNGFNGPPNGPHGPDVDGETKEAQVVSDANIGLTGSFTVRGVTSPDASFAEWYSCEDGDNPNSDASDCAPIATDTTGDSAPAPPGSSPALAWQARYDVPQTEEDDNPHDYYFVACSSDARPGGPAFDVSHCDSDNVQDIHTDNAQATGDHDPTSAGRIAMIVTPRGNFTDTASTHGAGLVNGETVTVIAFTNPGGADAIHFCWDFDTDEDTDDNNAPNDPGGGGCDHDFTDTTPTAGGGSGCHAQAPVAPGGECWSASGVPFANQEFGLAIVEYDDADDTDGLADSGSGDCRDDTEDPGDDGDDCQLDKIYLTTTLSGEPIPGVAPPPGPPPAPVKAKCKRIRGNKRDNKLRGTRGCDRMFGKGGDDKMRGRAGNDKLRGGPGFDIARGGPGRDTCLAEVRRSC